MSSSSSSPCFLGLPRELRDRIYEFALVSTSRLPVQVFSNQPITSTPKATPTLSPALLSTCRQVYAEAIDVLYTLNTFYAVVRMHPHHALRHVEVCRALQHIDLSPEHDPPEPEVVCTAARPRYCHPMQGRIRRFEIELQQIVPNQPHWLEGELKIDHTMNDLREDFLKDSKLEILILTTHGCAPTELWKPAANNDLQLARAMETLMWRYHEWHFERAFLSATRLQSAFWLRNIAHNDRISLTGDATFYHNLRALCNVETNERKGAVNMTRTIPSRFALREAEGFSDDDNVRSG